jgi:hypothetical protein
MIDKHRLALLLVAGALCEAGLTARAAPPDPYRTQLFNLLAKDASVIDGKTYYQAGFAQRFDALLASSSLARADENRVPLRQRLLSGPAPEPALVADPATGVRWLVYDACQAHRCDAVSLRLLFDPASRRMVGRLQLDRRFEFLGAPSVVEQRLLDQGR